MKNKKNIYLIVSISIFVGLLHFLIGPNYKGIWKHFISGYLLDILLPMNLYLLLQISLRKYFSIFKARIIGSIFTFSLGTIVEILQFYEINFLGRTYDPLDIIMYGIGTGLGIAFDLIVITKMEKLEVKRK